MVYERVARLSIPRDRVFVTVAGLLAGWLLTACALVHAEELEQVGGAIEREGLHEPVYRVSKTSKNTQASDALTAPEALVRPNADPHPLDPALELARNSLDHIEANIRDYTCTLVKRERVHGELLDYEFMTCKIRHECVNDGQAIPFGVYLSFLKPDTVKGREVIYVAGQNSGKLIAHEGGFKGRFIPTVTLLPTSAWPCAAIDTQSPRLGSRR